ncbi:PRC-barrel domain-containing protein [Pseudooceanicola aestuarii]|uniref:PRC-barrel domain-containing protein n=1 Tax=Pseudooceanicola aestuarii TaxID=2697319 RepID=UPI0013D0E6AD|nr:PRC-barrel domain-containing protein [Pseudooceanicola aestuarii]
MPRSNPPILVGLVTAALLCLPAQSSPARSKIPFSMIPAHPDLMQTREEQSERPTIAADLIGTDVITSGGTEVGEIDRIVLVDGDVMAVIGVGGFFGFGESQVMLPLTELSRRDSHLEAPGYTSDQLRALGRREPAHSKAVDGGTPVSVGSS